MTGAPERVFVWIGLLFGVFYLLITPPFQVPDEQVHFYRAYQLSQGGIVAEKIEGQVGGRLPSSVVATVDRLLEPLRFHPGEKAHLANVTELLSLPLNETDTRFVPFETSAIYAPVPYVPQLLGISIGRPFHASPLALFYLARLSNLIAAVSLVYFAIRTVPVLKWSFVMIALSPMALFQMASVSADGVTIGLSLLVVALFASAAWGSGAVDGRRLTIVIVASVLLSLAKLSVLIPLLYLMIPPRTIGSARRYAGVFILLMGACVLAAGMWSISVRSIYAPVSWVPGVDPARQARWVLSAPLRFLRLVTTDYLQHMPVYLQEMIGRYLGWFDTPLPPMLVSSYLIVLALLSLVDGDPGVRSGLRARGVLAAVLCANLVAISTALYLSYNPVGAGTLTGIQGRYFIPLLPIFLLLLYNRRIREAIERVAPGSVGSAYVRAAICLYSMIVSLVALRTLWERYYGIFAGPLR